jgi:hypothetical protein
MDFSDRIREDDPAKMQHFKGKSPWGNFWWERETWKGDRTERDEVNNELEWLRTQVLPNIRAEYWEKGVANLFALDALKGDLIGNTSSLWMREILFLRSHVPIKDQFDRWMTTDKFKFNIMNYTKYSKKWRKTTGDVSKAKKLKDRWDNQIPKVFRPLWGDSSHSVYLGIMSDSESENEHDCSELEWLREKVGNEKSLDYFRSGGTLENEKEWLSTQVDKLEFWKMQNKWLSEEEYNKKWISRVGDIDWITNLHERYENQPEIPENLLPPVCTICLTTINSEDEEDEMKAEAIECGHCFHSGCLNRWLEEKTSCPICRHPIQNGEDIDALDSGALPESDGDSDGDYGGVDGIHVEEIEVDGVTYLVDQRTIDDAWPSSSYAVYDHELYTNAEEVVRIGTYDSHRGEVILDT